MRQILTGIVAAAASLAVIVLSPVSAGAVSALVDAAWVRDNADAPRVVILDIRNKLGGDSEDSFRQGHIPGAVYSDYLSAGWRTNVDGVAGQLPPVADLEALIGGLGIGNDSHVVIVSGGASALDMGSATRVYWTFKVLGHDAVSILDGGHRAYAADPANPLATGTNAPTPKTFTARFRPEMLADRAEVVAAEKAGVTLVDMRPPAQFRGEQKHGLAKRAGTIPGAVNVPESQITNPDGRFVSADQVGELLAAAGVEPEADAISFCNTGHWASLGWFAKSEILGKKNVKLYDGSMVDYAARDELPIESKAQ